MQQRLWGGRDERSDTVTGMASYGCCIHVARRHLLPQGDPLKTSTWPFPFTPHAMWKACLKPQICTGFDSIALRQIKLTKAVLTDWALVYHSLKWGHIVWMTQSVQNTPHHTAQRAVCSMLQLEYLYAFYLLGAIMELLGAGGNMSREGVHKSRFNLANLI